MEGLGGNFVYRTSLVLLHRQLILIPWCFDIFYSGYFRVLRSRGICSAGEKTNNPSFPIRYIPKTLKNPGKPLIKTMPMNGSDKNVKIKGLDPDALRSEVLSKRMVLDNSSPLVIKPQNHHEGLVNELPNGSYQADDEIDYDEGTTEDELEENVVELKIQQGKFLSSQDLQAYEDKDDPENEAISLLATSDKASDSSKPVQHVLKNPLKLKNSQSRPTPLKGSQMNVTKKGVDRNTTRVDVGNGRMVSQNSFSDEKWQNLNQGPASNLTCFRQEAKNEIKYEDGTSNDEYMEKPEDNTKELGIHPWNYSMSQACENKEDAEKAAVKLLASRAYTAVELRKKLNAKRFPTSTIDAVIMDFQSRGLINDCFYAESYARSRWSSSSWGPRRVKQALRNKGVAEVDANEALKLVYKDEDQDSSLGLSKASLDQLYIQASKQWLRSQDISDETRKSRMIRWLQYRGFNWGVTSFILKKLESKLPL